MAAKKSKKCAVCGRTMTWRKRWEANWEQVRYCSRACRTRKLRAVDFELEETILSLLRTKTSGASIDPEDVARATRPEDPPAQHALREGIRNAARRLSNRGLVDILANGRPAADPSTTTGPIQLRLSGRAAGHGPPF